MDHSRNNVNLKLNFRRKCLNRGNIRESAMVRNRDPTQRTEKAAWLPGTLARRRPRPDRDRLPGFSPPRGHSIIAVLG